MTDLLTSRLKSVEVDESSEPLCASYRGTDILYQQLQFDAYKSLWILIRKEPNSWYES